ncbi:MAG: hypothetical protein ABIK12_18995 [Pseudomonadota bacterium]
MKKIATMFLAFGLLIAGSGMAYAWWCPYDGFGYPGGAGYMQGTSGYMSDPLGQALAAKEGELRALLAQPNPDQNQVAALNGQINNLRSQLGQRYGAGMAQPYMGGGWGGPGFCW